MKKLISILIVLFLLSACGGNSEILDPALITGKTLEEASEFLAADLTMLAYGYGFAEDLHGNPVVLLWEIDENDQIRITDAFVCDRRNVDNSPGAFAQLEPGMTIFQVVERIGIPSSIPATGVFYLEFTDSEGTVYYLSWHGDPICLGAIIHP